MDGSGWPQCPVSQKWNHRGLWKNLEKFPFFRVKNSWTGQAVLSLLSLKSAITVD
jgi:hypothetical protein